MPIALIYHDVAAPEMLDRTGFPGPLAARYKLTPERFEQHLDAFAALGVTVTTELVGAADGDLLLTFDDGGKSALEIADRLEARGWRGCFFIVSSLIGRPGFLDPDEIADLHSRGHLIGSHSHTHPTYMGKLSPAELDFEWRTSRELIAATIDAAPDYASIPGGFSAPAVLASAERCGYRALFTSEPDDRPRRRGALRVSGRYSIWATTPAARAAAYVSDSAWARRRLALEWKLKQGAKRASPRVYEWLRRLRAG